MLVLLVLEIRWLSSTESPAILFTLKEAINRPSLLSKLVITEFAHILRQGFHFKRAIALCLCKLRSGRQFQLRWPWIHRAATPYLYVFLKSFTLGFYNLTITEGSQQIKIGHVIDWINNVRGLTELGPQVGSEVGNHDQDQLFNLSFRKYGNHCAGCSCTRWGLIYSFLFKSWVRNNTWTA